MEGAAVLGQNLELTGKLALPTLEREARELELDPTVVYAPRQLARMVTEKAGEEAEQLRELLFHQEEAIPLQKSAQIMVRPARLRQAVVCQAIRWILEES